MIRVFMRVTVALLSLLLATAVVNAGQAVELKLKDGSKWRGQVSDLIQVHYSQQGAELAFEGKLVKAEPLYVVIEGIVTGKPVQKTFFRTDIVSVKSVGGDPSSPAAGSPDTTPKSTAPGGSNTTTPAGDAGKPATGEKELGVFVLPMSGMVGEGFRHNEIDAIAREADKIGPHQIIVLDIESGGGLGIEMEQIHFTIAEIKKRHRVVAWIKEAISAAAATASNCDEIYFRTTGSLGAMTGFAGGVSLKGEELYKWLRSAGEWMECGGRSKYIAYAMIDDEALLSYDKNPDTGEVTWHNDLSGKVIMSDAKSNLVFTATTAKESKFASGIADTNDELAKELGLPKWHEINDSGRRIAADWLRTVAQAKDEIPRLAKRLNYAGTGTGDGQVILGKRIQIFTDLIKWWDKCPNVCFLSGVPSKDELERQLAELRRALANMKK